MDIVTGNDDAIAPSIMVAIIDSGVKADHPDLINSDIRLGWDYIDWDHCYRDSNGHGTGVTGVIAAGTNNAEGIAGFAGILQLSRFLFRIQKDLVMYLQ
jgi:subtilisin family serine protease